MPLKVPDLDDRSFEDLVNEAMVEIQKKLKTDWNDLSPGDPGIVLLEAFAYLTEQMIYRLNRLPNKVFIAFLRLLGVSLYPPTAARAKLAFYHDFSGDVSTTGTDNEPAAEPKAVQIPHGTIITMSATAGIDEPPLFVTAEDITVPITSIDEATAAEVMAFQIEYIAAEPLAQRTTGQPGQVVQVRRPPIVAKMYNDLDLKVGIELGPDEAVMDGDIPVTVGRDANEVDIIKFFRIWDEVPNFADLTTKSQVYVVDRFNGTIQFAPAARLEGPIPQEKASDERQEKPGADSEAEQGDDSSKSLIGDQEAGDQSEKNEKVIDPSFHFLAAVPREDREIRVWYPRGGGEAGNNIRTLDAFHASNPALVNIKVINRAPSRGGMDVETLDNALIRGPQEVYALQRVVTAQDFERVILQYSRAIARVKAFAKFGLWRHAIPGTVEVVKVPAIPGAGPRDVTLSSLIENQREEALVGLDEHLRQRIPIGTQVERHWARYKQVKVHAELIIQGNEKKETVADRVSHRLLGFLSPLPLVPPPNDPQRNEERIRNLYRTVRPFGQSVRISELYKMILDTEDRRVSLIRSLSCEVAHVPDRDVNCVASDHFQPCTWYAGSANRLFRSINHGTGWELMCSFAPGEKVFEYDPDVNSYPEIELAREESVQHIHANPYQAGFVIASTQTVNQEGQTVSPLYFSNDCGETWYRILQPMGWITEDISWLRRPSGHYLLLATSSGLIEVEIPLSPKNQPQTVRASESIPLFPQEPGYPLYAVTVIQGRRGNLVAVAPKGRRGVYLSQSADLVPPPKEPGENGTTSRLDGTSVTNVEASGAGQAVLRAGSSPFKTSPIFAYIGCLNEDIRHLNVVDSDDVIYLWAGSMAKADEGRGCYRWAFNVTPQRIEKSTDEGWVGSNSWTGGSCYAVAFQRLADGTSRTLAITAWGGVLFLDEAPNQRLPVQALQWRAIPHTSLPLREYQLSPREDGAPNSEASTPTDTTGSHVHGTEEHVHFFLPINAIATNQHSAHREEPTVMVGGPKGIDRSFDNGRTFKHVTNRLFERLTDEITVPHTWLLVADEPNIIVRVDDELEQRSAQRGTQ